MQKYWWYQTEWHSKSESPIVSRFPPPAHPLRSNTLLYRSIARGFLNKGLNATFQVASILIGWTQRIRCLPAACSVWATAGQRFAKTSAASTFGFFARAFLVVFRIPASLKPACLNSFRKAPPSLAPLIQANQSASVGGEESATGSMRISSAV